MRYACEIFQQTVKVGQKSYMIDWHRMPWKKSLVVPLMISMSRSTTKITAGNIIELSISSFGNVSISYISTVKQVVHVVKIIFYREIFTKNYRSSRLHSRI